MSLKHADARNYAPGIGEAVANRTINRDVETVYKRKQTVKAKLAWDSTHDLDEVVAAWCNSKGYIHESYTVGEGAKKGFINVNIVCTAKKRKETWSEVAERVARGNVNLVAGRNDSEFTSLYKHIAKATLLTSGRHLQHGDETQKDRNMEIFTNCSTSAASFVTFYLLLNGSGVGRSYDDDLMVVDWSSMPIVMPVIDHSHKDSESGEISALTRAEAEHMYKFAKTTVFDVPDTREGWAKAIEKIETMAYLNKSDEVLILDFSGVRPRGSGIAGMQNRPASGPGPLMEAIGKMKAIRGSGMRPWRAAMFVDHYLSECVLVGGARRAARMSTKSWRDKGVLEFIQIKRGGHLWSSNNSVTVDQEFWNRIDSGGSTAAHAQQVLHQTAHAAYHDGTGEPGLINQDMLVDKGDTSIYLDGDILSDGRYKADENSKQMFGEIARRAMDMPYSMIVNPCGEIPLLMWGGYCVLADVVPYHADNDDEAEDAFRVAARFLMRVNTMESLYWREVNRTNRIGVSMTGIHEYALSRFGYKWEDLVDEQRSLPFWEMLSRFKRAVDEECIKYAEKLGVVVPHTNTTIKPAGTTSKLFGLTEGAHLPAMREYLRMVQFRNDDPLVTQYEAKGYPVTKLRTYGGTTIVGFPTRPEICNIIDDPMDLTTAPEATPAEQYEWIRLLEKYWLRGVDEKGNELSEDTGNQISYTLKLDTSKVSYNEYLMTLIEEQSTVKCCTIMPENPESVQVYEYLPETPITKDEYERILEALNVDTEEVLVEDVDMETLQCAAGACPI